MAYEPNTPGARLKEAREKHGLSRADLARRMSCALSAVSSHENGINGIRASTAAAYAELLGITPQWLLYGDGDGASRAPAMRPGRSGVQLTELSNGRARLELDRVMPFSVALQILALVQGDEK